MKLKYCLLKTLERGADVVNRVEQVLMITPAHRCFPPYRGYVGLVTGRAKRREASANSDGCSDHAA